MTFANIHSSMIYYRKQSIFSAFVVLVKEAFATTCWGFELTWTVMVLNSENFRKINVFFEFDWSIPIYKTL
jgi:hypothetical protein